MVSFDLQELMIWALGGLSALLFVLWQWTRDHAVREARQSERRLEDAATNLRYERDSRQTLAHAILGLLTDPEGGEGKSPGCGSRRDELVARLAGSLDLPHGVVQGVMSQYVSRLDPYVKHVPPADPLKVVEPARSDNPCDGCCDNARDGCCASGCIYRRATAWMEGDPGRNSVLSWPVMSREGEFLHWHVSAIRYRPHGPNTPVEQREIEQQCVAADARLDKALALALADLHGHLTDQFAASTAATQPPPGG